METECLDYAEFGVSVLVNAYIEHSKMPTSNAHTYQKECNTYKVQYREGVIGRYVRKEA